MVVIRSDGVGSKDELRTPFVERRTYRRRRLMDVARIAPVLGALLFMVPLLWPSAEDYGAIGGAIEGGRGIKTSAALVYLVSVWLGSIVFAFGFSASVRRWAVHWTGRNGAETPPPLAPTQEPVAAEARQAGAAPET